MATKEPRSTMVEQEFIKKGFVRNKYVLVLRKPVGGLGDIVESTHYLPVKEVEALVTDMSAFLQWVLTLKGQEGDEDGRE